MSTTPEQIRDLLVGKLEELLDDNDVSIFVDIIGNADGVFNGYPSATVEYTGGDGQVIDTHTNERVHHFVISLYHSVNEEVEKAEVNDRLLSIICQTITAFDKDRDLGGEVMIVNVTKINSSTKVSAGAWRFAEIMVDARILVPNY